ncbi:hypothetical protein FRC02_011506 [Tulasnella sp. 418]|nr:hypothetical protein FRC02_011506 [Tulasnella sp. 418]
MVDEELPNFKLESTFTRLDSQVPSIDILKPFGELLSQVAIEAEELEEEEDEPEEDEDAIQTLPNEANGGADESTELDLEDAAGVEDSLAEQTKVLPTVEVSGKSVYKACVLRELSKYHAIRGSTDRLKRVANLARYVVKSSGSANLIDQDTVFNDSAALVLNDPATTLLRCEGQVFLAVVQINQIKIDTNSTDTIAVDLLLVGESTVSIGFQILQLVPVGEENDIGADWEWSQRYEASHKTCRRFVQPLNPAISTANQDIPTYIF